MLLKRVAKILDEQEQACECCGDMFRADQLYLIEREGAIFEESILCIACKDVADPNEVTPMTDRDI